MTSRTVLVRQAARTVLKQVGTMRQTVLRVAPIVVSTGDGASLPIAQSDVTGLVTRLDNMDSALLLKATQAALDALAVVVDSKATADDVAQAIADLLATDTQVLQTLQQFAQALADYDDLLEALEYTVANRVRFDTSAQGLTSLQKANARNNIAAEEIGTAAALIALLSQVASTGDYNHLINKPSIPTYQYSYIDKTLRQVGLTIGSTLDVFGAGAIFSTGQLQLDDVIEVEIWIKTTGAATGNVQMLLSANGSATVNTLNLSLTSDSRTRLSKYKSTIIVDWQTVSGALLPVLYISNDGTTRGTFTEQSIVLGSFGESQALSLVFTVNVSTGLSAGAELAVRKALINVTRN